MAEQKGIGKKLLGLFVEQEGGADEQTPQPEEGGKSAADLVAELAGQTAPQGGRPAADEPPPPNLKMDKLTAAGPAGDKVNFDQIFKDGGLDPTELDKVKKAEDLLKSLPEATPHEVKKQIVEASMRAFGIEPITIIQAASNQLRALDVYVKANSDLTVKAIGEAEQQIKALNEKISLHRAEIEKRTGQLTVRTNAATTRKSEVQRVLDFFGAPAAPKP